MRSLMMNLFLLILVFLAGSGAYTWASIFADRFFEASSGFTTVKLFVAAGFGLFAFVLPFHPYYAIGAVTNDGGKRSMLFGRRKKTNGR